MPLFSRNTKLKTRKSNIEKVAQTHVITRLKLKSEISHVPFFGVKEALQTIVTLGKHLGLEPPAKRSQVELGERSLQALYQYLKNNFSGIVDYHTFKRNGFYISSVVAEKTIDLLVCRRQKLRGQNCSREGAENILTFRKLILNGHWKAYWQHRKAA